MSTFIESAACRGRRPVNLVASVHHARSDLLAKLLLERRVARFLVAPDGFGKSSLAYAYADVVFAFDRVFWLNGRSPCFLRDLDAGAIEPGMRRVEESPALVVFDDVPHLDAERAEEFATLVSSLLEHDCEVIVTCTPSCDTFGSKHRGRMVVRPRDLLLSEEEATVGLRGERIGDGFGVALKPAERIACLCWKEGGSRDIATGISRESIPSDMLLAMFAMLLFGRGHVGDLRSLLPIGDRRFAELVRALEEGYPFLGIVRDEGTFESAAFSVRDLKCAFEASLESIVASSAFAGKEALVACLADALLTRGMQDRAADLVLAFSTKIAAGTWLGRRGWSLVEGGSALSARRLFDEVVHGTMKLRPTCNVVAAWASHILNDPMGATTFARRSAFRSGASISEKMLACILLVRESSGTCSDQARSVLETLLEEARRLPRLGKDLPDGPDDGAPDAYPSRSEAFIDAELLADLALAFRKGHLHGASRWARALGECGGDQSAVQLKAVENALLLSASWLFDALTSEEQARFAFSLAEKRLASALDFDQDPEAVALSAARFVVAALERSCRSGQQLGWCCYCAMAQLERAGEHLPALASFAASTRSMAQLASFESFIRTQREEFRRMCSKRDRQVDEYYEVRPNAFRNDARTSRTTTERTRLLAPTMHVNLFGDFEVWLGDERVESSDLKRRKVKALLAILVIARGREVTKERLAEALWPHSNARAAKKNLYTTWAILTRALSRDGSCPYLVRDHQGCWINSQLVTSDLSEFESLCRTLRRGEADDASWEQLYSRLEAAYAEDFMPDEVSVEYIAAVRDRYRARLIEALMEASRCLVSTGEAQGALWFAREAYERDRMREDVYLALMEAQIAAGQRGAAIETYLSCKRMLAEQLGIDPSPRIVALYREIIETEEVLA